jgi:prepilin-type N-terminal cleavage/methylation domain-containing protein
MNVSAVRRSLGFTLIEIIVGLAVGGIVILAGFTALATVQDRSQHARVATTSALEGSTARATLVEWLATAQLQSTELDVRFEGQNAQMTRGGLVVEARFEGMDAQEQGLESDEITFPMRAPTPLRMPITQVRLYVDNDPATAERGLVADLAGRLGEVPKRMVLAPQAIALMIRYLPNVDGPVEWAESWVGQNQLPRAIELTLVDDPREPLPPLLRLPIRVAMATLQ